MRPTFYESCFSDDIGAWIVCNHGTGCTSPQRNGRGGCARVVLVVFVVVVVMAVVGLYHSLRIYAGINVLPTG